MSNWTPVRPISSRMGPKFRLSGKRSEDTEAMLVGELETQLDFRKREGRADLQPDRDDQFGSRLPFEIKSLAVGVVEFEIEAELQTLFRKQLLQKAIAVAAIENEFAFLDGQRDFELLRLFGQEHVGFHTGLADFEPGAVLAAEQECQPFVLCPSFLASPKDVLKFCAPEPAAERISLSLK